MVLITIASKMVMPTGRSDGFSADKARQVEHER